jgi:hypothetical protein
VEANVTRDHVVSIRLTAAERDALGRLGGRPSDVFRRLLRDALRPAQWPLVITTSPTAPGHCVWMDETVGQTWPQAATR